MLKIAITTRKNEDLSRFFIKSSYYAFLEDDFIINPVLPNFHHYDEIANDNDALLICGGDDINPLYYHQDLSPHTQLENSLIESMDFKLIHAFQKQHKPIIGICRGIQVINVYLGGTLIQHIDNHTSPHHIRIHQHTLLSQFFYPIQYVNSFHHQCVVRCGAFGRPVAVSADGLVEAMETDQPFFYVGVQWHPERMLARASSRALFQSFLLACKQRRTP